jgi:hypothetical protein
MADRAQKLRSLASKLSQVFQTVSEPSSTPTSGVTTPVVKEVTPRSLTLHDFDCGIILIRSRDPFSNVTCAITKDEFSSIGMYYRSTISGDPKIYVIIRDVFGCQSPYWLYNGETLNDVIQNPIVTKIALCELGQDTDGNFSRSEEELERLRIKFRSAAAKLSSTEPQKSIREVIQQIFGHRIDRPGAGSTSVEFINKIILDIGHWSDVPQINQTGTISVPTTLNENIDGRLDLFTLMGAGFRSQPVENPSVSNKFLRSYIVPNRLFGPISYLDLPDRDAIKRMLSYTMAVNRYQRYLRDCIGEFVSMISDDQEFFNVVVAGFNQESQKKQEHVEQLKMALMTLNGDVTAILELLHQWFDAGTGVYSDLKNLINEIVQHQIDASKVVDQPLVSDPSPLLNLAEDGKLRLEITMDVSDVVDLDEVHRMTKAMTGAGRINLKNCSVDTLRKIAEKLNRFVSSDESELKLSAIRHATADALAEKQFDEN